MTHNQNYNPSAFAQLSGAHSVFQPGFAGTNVQEVQAWNSGYHPQQAMSQAPTNLYSQGFANTNVQEVRALNSGQPTPTVANQSYGGGLPATYGFQNYGSNQNYGMNQVHSSLHNYQSSANLGNNANQSYGPIQGYGGFNNVFQPGFAGTNVQEVRSLNAGHFTPGTSQGLSSGGGHSIYNNGFANTNVQEVRALNYGQPVSGVSYQSYGNQAPQAYSYSGLGSVLGSGNYGASNFTNQQSVGNIHQPGFAGTNVQEVQTWNSGYHPHQTMNATTASIQSPGFANTNVQEVRSLNSGQPTPSAQQHAYGQVQGLGTGFQGFTL
ncbi:hypothetical protein [Brevibacillus daliensis]|uniref:hypothetical protein n=1 Tax=Brevibacillus daliensis TaxID=2892995 RepID=UPI001E53682D|nr:hypothetical protein [Brevibacillus daliensis]